MAAPPLEYTPDHARARARALALALAQQLRTLREARGWSRERLAKEAGVQPRTLARVESGGAIQPGFFTIGALAAALEVSLDDLCRPTTPTHGLWSAGYEGRDIDSFVASLVESRIDVVADVRLTPISRKPGFSKTRLGQALAEAGIEYIHLRALGNPKDNRAPFWDGRLGVGRARFRSLLRSDEAQADLDRLTEQASLSRVAVLCFEQDESRCHRHVVLTAVRKRIEVPVVQLA
ncbi:DUF488 family protein, N3 subclade [Streptomyces sp. NBC_00273]|uniref:DUF488 family protein, N3 subclade n=1 Tax=Streptomyces sp. NBC_00273 TaxID=2903644 RepID=UPI002E298024|nr:DUF488 family protein [Streptomyces sp. NBC_00273]